jgi:hypothetical protein
MLLLAGDHGLGAANLSRQLRDIGLQLIDPEAIKRKDSHARTRLAWVARAFRKVVTHVSSTQSVAS